jgi:sugar lactone lactonase YvrE
MRTYALLMLFLLPQLAICQIIKTVAGNGIAGYNGDNLSALVTEFDNPNTVAFDATGNMYICDFSNNRVRKLSASGLITTVAGNGTPGFSGDGGPATLAELGSPDGIAIDNSGNIYLSIGGHRIRKIDASGIITTIAGTGTPGYNGDNIPATSAQLFDPYVGAVDNAGNLYFSDYNNHRIRKINTTGIITTIAGNGSNTSGGDGGPATTAQLGGPAWLYRNAAGEFYIPDNSFNCVRKVDASGIITTFAGTGVAGNTGNGGLAIAATFMQPNSITFDNIGNAYIADYGASVLRKVNGAGIISTVAGTGTSTYSGDGGPATLAGMTVNSTVSDIGGNVYIADVNNNRIRRITYNSTGVSNVNNALDNVTIYPNPAYDKITVKATPSLPAEIIISNTIGQEVYRQPYSNAAVDISSYAAGIYFVKVNGVYAGSFVKE